MVTLDVRFHVTRSSHPDFEYFGNLTINGVQKGAYRFNTMEEADKIVKDLEASRDKNQVPGVRKISLAYIIQV